MLGIMVIVLALLTRDNVVFVGLANMLAMLSMDWILYLDHTRL